MCHSGYNLARVRYDVLVAPDAGKQLAALPAHGRSEVRDGIELHLRFEPTKLSKSRIKRLQGLEALHRVKGSDFEVVETGERSVQGW